MVAGVGIDDAGAARRNPVEAALVEGLKEYENRTRLLQVLRVDQLLGGPELAGGDEILHAGDDQRNDHPGLRDASGLPDHPWIYCLGLDLPEAGLQPVLVSVVGYQD